MTFSAEGGNSAYKVRSKNDGFLGPYSPFLVGGSKLLQGGGPFGTLQGHSGAKLHAVLPDSKNFEAWMLKKSKVLSLRCKKVCHKRK